MKPLTRLLGAVALVMSAPCVIAANAGEANKDGTNESGPANAITLTVGLPDPGQKILYVHEVIPVKPGALTLYYPKWIPGDHSPDGTIDEVMGLQFAAAGRPLAWQRDELDRFVFHLTVPQDAQEVDIRFQFPGGNRVTSKLMDLTWDQVALYRAGDPTKTQIFQPTIVIPANWQYASALETATHDDGRIAFKPVPFNTLVDSPVIAGKHFRTIDLTPAGSAVHRYLDIVGDSAAAIVISDKQVAGYRNLVEQAQALFHTHHYASYHFLLTLSDHTSVGGLEHHQSSDDRARGGSRMLVDAGHFMLDGSLLPHEYTHSWNGKFMRPAGLWQPDFAQPQYTKLLWVYEGLTVYLGDVLTARSGLWSADTWREVLAYRAASMAYRSGRAWRPLIDTTTAVNYGAPSAWVNWRRENDFYPEGELLWLAVDAKIRELSNDKYSIDDFAQNFFGIDDGSFVTHTYTFDDVVAALDKVQPYNWQGFLNDWVSEVGERMPLLSGIEASGWRLVYTDQPSGYQNALENVGMGELEGKGINAMFTIGVFLKNDGKVLDVLWDGPAFKAGLTPGMKLISINGRPFASSVLREEIVNAQKTKKPLQLRVENDGVRTLHAVHYDGGLRYPNLLRAPGKVDYLQQILAAKPVAKGS